MTRRQRLADSLRRWENNRSGASYLLRMMIAQRVMPSDMRLLTLRLWAEFQGAKLAHLERLAREMDGEEDEEVEIVEVPIEYLARYL